MLMPSSSPLMGICFCIAHRSRSAPQHETSLIAVRTTSMSMKNKVAIVTGGATMIGEGVVAALVAEGCKVTIADIDAVKGPAVAARYDGCQFVATDVADDASIAACVARTVAAFGGIDFL